MIALIDADSLLYKVGFAIEDKVTWNQFDVEAGIEDEADVEYYTDIQQCKDTLEHLIDNILFATDCEKALLVFSGEGNFRLSLPTAYKENRKESRRPLDYEALLQHAKDTYDTITTTGMEADDLVVYMKTSDPEEYILCAIDKDVLYQTVGAHYNYGRDEETVVEEFEAIRFAYFQTLTGDITDGYKGVPGIGPKKAEKILSGCKTEAELWEAVVSTYETHNMTKEDAVWTMRLANMHQYNGSEIVLWEPPDK